MDDLVFNCGFERNDEGAIGLRFDFELLYSFVFMDVSAQENIQRYFLFKPPRPDSTIDCAEKCTRQIVHLLCPCRKRSMQQAQKVHFKSEQQGITLIAF